MQNTEVSMHAAIAGKSRVLRESLSKPDTNLAFTELEWEPNCSVYWSIANSMQDGFECHIRRPFDWEAVSANIFHLLADGDPAIVDQYRKRCLMLCQLFQEVAGSLQTIMFYGMVGGGKEVLDFPWHVDRVALTMVDTVVGPGTLWVANKEVRREAFADSYIADTTGPSPLVADASLREIPQGTVAFFKGELRQDHDYPAVQVAIKENGGREFNRGKGLVHASPSLPLGEKRLFFCAMTFAVPDYMRNF